MFRGNKTELQKQNMYSISALFFAFYCSYFTTKDAYDFNTGDFSNRVHIVKNKQTNKQINKYINNRNF